MWANSEVVGADAHLQHLETLEKLRLSVPNLFKSINISVCSGEQNRHSNLQYFFNDKNFIHPFMYMTI